MVASRFQAAAVACVITACLIAKSRISYCNGTRGENAAAQACLTHRRPSGLLGLSDGCMTRGWKHNRMLKPWSDGQIYQLGWTKKMQLCHVDRAEKNNGWVDLRWGGSTRAERSWEEKREMTGGLKRVKQEAVHKDGRWEELTRGDKLVRQIAKWCKICSKSSEVPERGWKSATAPLGKPLDPIAS